MEDDDCRDWHNVDRVGYRSGASDGIEFYIVFLVRVFADAGDR